MSAHRRTATPSHSNEYSDSAPAMMPLNVEEPLDLQPKTKLDSSQSMQLPVSDRPRFILLIILYLIQGVPIGLAFGAVPFLLKSNDLSYSQVGLFSLATYPYSFKILWSPIVDSIYSKILGRRRSWILPIQCISGISLIYLGARIDYWMESDADILANLSYLTYCFFFLILLCATQDIAVDGWALTILSKGALSFASTAQTVGLNTGYFISFTVFLAFNSSDFANKYFRAIPSDTPLISLGQYMTLSGILYLVVTLVVGLFVPENPPHLSNPQTHDLDDEINNDVEDDTVVGVYRKMISVIKLPAVKTFIILHLVCKIGFQVNEGATNLKLLDLGLKREDLAITVLIDFPFEIIFGYYVAKWSNSDSPLLPWQYGYIGRIIAAIFGQLLVHFFPKSGQVGTLYFFFVILQHLLTSFMSTVQFVSITSFHTQVADVNIGGTYMTLLNTLSNLGGTWPKLVAFWLIDQLSDSLCMPESSIVPSMSKSDIQSLASDHQNPFKIQPFYHCYKHDLKQACIVADGQCVTIRDGYAAANVICILLGLAIYYGWIRSTVAHLQQLRRSAWRVGRKNVLPV